METFQKRVLAIATVVLIIILILVAIFHNNAIKSQEFPPIETECPDYWDMSGNYCTPPGNNVNDCNPLATDCSINTINKTFWEEQAGSKNPDFIKCAKHKWARKNDVQWDGISNNFEICDSLI
jgi:hypothetical protein